MEIRLTKRCSVWAVALMMVSCILSVNVSAETLRNISDGSIVIESGSGDYIITQNNPETATPNTITVNAGYTGRITLKDVNIAPASGGTDAPFKIAPTSTVTLVLDGVNTLNARAINKPGLHVPRTADGNSIATVIIQAVNPTNNASGTLNAYGGTGVAVATDTSNVNSGAGIGGAPAESNGAVIINSGTIVANSHRDVLGTPLGLGRAGAAIGGGGSTTDNLTGGGNGGDIIINGGTVTAIGGISAAGIGGGRGGHGGNIIINNGTVTATGGVRVPIGTGTGAAWGPVNAAGIGGGAGWSAKVEINGGTIKAFGSGNGAGIGSGHQASATLTPVITINGGDIIAMGGNNSAGIGGGETGIGGSITISGGNITAIAGGVADNGNVTQTNTPRGNGAAIGGGGSRGVGSIIITDGTITARSATGSAIGTGANPTTVSGNIIISGGVINAETSGTNYMTIGAAQNGDRNRDINAVIILPGATITNLSASATARHIGKAKSVFYMNSYPATIEGDPSLGSLNVKAAGDQADVKVFADYTDFNFENADLNTAFKSNVGIGKFSLGTTPLSAIKFYQSGTTTTPAANSKIMFTAENYKDTALNAADLNAANREEILYPALDLDIKCASDGNAKATFDCKSGYYNDSYLIFATYGDEGNKLINCDFAQITDGKAYVDLIDLSDGMMLRAFVWKDFDNIKPIEKTEKLHSNEN